MFSDNLEEVMLCPFCGGGMVIQLDSQHKVAGGGGGGGSQFTTPIGSLTNSAPTSPWKHSTPAK